MLLVCPDPFRCSLSLRPVSEKESLTDTLWHDTGLVKKNILKSQDAGVALSEAMIAKAPEAQKAEAAELEKRRVAAFKKAVDAFANSTGGEDTAIGDDDSD